MKNRWKRMNGISFIKEMALNGQEPTLSDNEVILKCIYRPDVQSGRWWTLEWTSGDGERCSQSASTPDIVFERAAEIELIKEEGDAKDSKNK